jgi:hypothetical protein
VGLSRKGSIFRTPGAPSKNYEPVLKVAFSKLIALHLLTPSLPYVYTTDTIQGA